MVKFNNNWDMVLKGEFEKPYYLDLRQKLKHEYSNYTIYPDMYDIFAAFKATDYHAVKVLILGQDPYHNPNEAHGLCFSVKEGVKSPPSLVNIFKELNNELGIQMPKHGCLTAWAQQGVLLLNSILTVRAGCAASHREIGWQKFTDNVIQRLNERQKPVIFMLWGNYAKSKKHMISSHHFVLEAAHPSPLSCHNGFFGCGHFARANEILEGLGEKPIDWSI